MNDNFEKLVNVALYSEPFATILKTPPLALNDESKRFWNINMLLRHGSGRENKKTIIEQ